MLGGVGRLATSARNQSIHCLPGQERRRHRHRRRHVVGTASKAAASNKGFRRVPEPKRMGSFPCSILRGKGPTVKRKLQTAFHAAFKPFSHCSTALFMLNPVQALDIPHPRFPALSVLVTELGHFVRFQEPQICLIPLDWLLRECGAVDGTPVSESCK